MSEDGPAGFTSRAGTGAMHADPSVIDLMVRAGSGDKRSWDALVEQCAPLVWSICRRYRLSRADAEEVGQSVWLLLVDELGRVRDPAALSGWLATITRRECRRVLRAADGPGRELLEAERHAALRAAFAQLPPDDQRLIALLIADPAPPYAEISVRLGISIGSVDQNRSRCLAAMRRHPAIAALINSTEV